MKQNLKTTASALTLCIVGASFAAPAVAQDVTDEIIVTATRRAETVQDIPINISAIGAANLEEQGFTEISEVLAYVPGINVVDQGGRNGNVLIVRGINANPLGQGSGNGTGGTVATYLGEVPLSLDLNLNDLQRVEVLLGPQGTLYGAGTMGGAIRYIPNKPDFSGEMFELRAGVSATQESASLSGNAGFTFNLPISDNFALRGSLDHSHDAGFIDYNHVVKAIGFSEPDPTTAAGRAANINPIEDANGQDVFSGRIAARFEPTDYLDATLTYHFQNEDNEGRTTSGRRGVLATGDYESPSRVREPNKEKSQLLALEVTADLGFAELTSATGLGKYEEIGQRDQTDLLIGLEYSYETFPTFTSFTREEEESEFINQEVRLVSTGDARYNWIVGAFYNKEKAAGQSSEFTPGYGAANGFRTDLNDLEYFSVSRSELEEKAFFGEIGFDITDAWDVTLGGRAYEYTLENAGAVDGQSTVYFPYFEPASFAPFPLSANGDLDIALNQAYDGTLFKVNSSYKLGNGNMVYGTISEGYRIGASNGLTPCPDVFMAGNQGQCGLVPGQQFGPNAGDIAQFNELEYFPDTTTNYELGAKTKWLDGALTLNGALFYVDWIDPQVSSASVNASIPITINASGAESKGFELNGDWRISDAFRLRGSLSHTKTELTEAVPSLIRTIVPGGGFSTAFIDGEVGDRLPGSPETQYSVFASYDYPLASGNELHFNGGYSWQSDVLSITGGRGNRHTLDAFGVANSSVVYDADNWSVTGYVNNLLNEYAETGVQGSALSNQTVSGATVRSFQVNVLTPRTMGVRLKYRFE